MSPSSRRLRTPARSPRSAGTRWRAVSRQVLAGGLTLGLGMTALGYAAATDLAGVNAGYAARPAVSAPAAGVMVAGVDRPLLAAPVSRGQARAALTSEQLRAATGFVGQDIARGVDRIMRFGGLAGRFPKAYSRFNSSHPFRATDRFRNNTISDFIPCQNYIIREEITHRCIYRAAPHACCTLAVSCLSHKAG